MKTSGHFDDEVSKKPDRQDIKWEWCEKALYEPEYIEEQSNGWTKQWSYIQEKGRWLRIVVLADSETVHTNFWDRRFERKLERWRQGLEPGLRRQTGDED